jgi:ABC-type amino acid transport substrate-binding protein
MTFARTIGWGRALAFAALIAVLPALQASTVCADTLDRIRHDGKVRVGVGLFGTKPYLWQESGKYKGFENEVLDALIAKLGVKSYEYVITDWSTLIPGLKSDRWDIIMSGMVKNEERVQGGGIAMSRPYFFVYDRLIVNENSKLASTADIKGKVLGSVMGTTDSMVAHSLVDRGMASDVRDFNTFAEPFLALANNQVDAVVLDQVTFLGQKADMPNIKVIGDPEFYVVKPEWAAAQAKADYKLGGAAIGTRVEDTALLQAINKALDELDSEGTRQKIFEKYGIWDQYQTRAAMMK